MEPLPTIRQLQYLCALAEVKSFSKAAAQCHVTQSTLSAGIRELETLLHRKLVDRTRRRIVLTPFGLSIIEDARHVLNGAGTITAKARAAGAPLSGPLRIGIIPTVAPYLLPAVLPGLQTAYPALALHISEDQSARLTAQLDAGTLDVIMLALPYETPGMTQVALFDEPFLLACPQNGWQEDTPVTLDSLAGKKLLLLEDGHCLRDHALAACRFRARADDDSFTASSLPTLIQFVKHGYGITLLPDMAVKNTALTETLDILPFKDPPPTRRIGLAWRAGHPQEEEFALLAQAIKTAALA